MGIEGYILKKLLFDGWVKLSCCVYLLKHKTLFNSERISSLHASLMASTLPDDNEMASIHSSTPITEFITVA